MSVYRAIQAIAIGAIGFAFFLFGFIHHDGAFLAGGITTTMLGLIFAILATWDHRINSGDRR